MVCTVKAIKTAGVAAKYYDQTDNYYREKGHSPTAWVGRGAEALGLRGEVTIEQATAMLEGRLPSGERVGCDDHRPGWDLTFSAPKSVSVAAYVHGDDRLIAAHDAAVRDALAFVEREVAATRIRENGEIRTEATGNLVVATYRHDLNREAEMQIHTHNVVMNVTRSADGAWRSLESRAMYRIQTEAGAVYRAALARECERLGWQTEKTQEGGHPSFELAAISAAERDMFSTRSRQIEAELQKLGLTRETATAEQKEIAALNTRNEKEPEIDRSNLMSLWREQHRQAGFEPLARPVAAEIPEGEYRSRADAAVREAVEHLSERDTRFTERQIVAEARKHNIGQIDDRDIRAAVARAAERGELVARETRQFDAITGQKQQQAGFASRESVETEMRMLATADRAARSVQPVMTLEQADAAIRDQETKPGAYAFNDAQRDATRAVLAGTDRITLIQGFAGTAKTTSVLAASAAALQARGHEVIALAPTHSAAKTLGDSIVAESHTVASFLHKRQEASEKPRIYIVDEASMLSARDMDKLLSRTAGAGGRVVMVGDVKQLGSVEAGAAFRQLQEESRLPTQVLDTIVRQRDDQLREAVYDAIKGDAHGALEKVEVREIGTREDRVAEIAKVYTCMSREDREKTIIVAPGRDDRREINDAVRSVLRERGELGDRVHITALDSRDMTNVERRRASNYSVGELVQAGRDYQSLGLKKGDMARIVDVDVGRNRLTLETAEGVRKEIDPSRLTKLQAYQKRDMEVAIGDRLVNRANTDKLRNGVALRVEKIHDGQIHVRDDAGKLHKLDSRELHKLDHGYAQTGHESQGRTCKTVLVHGESNRVNLTNQQNMYVGLSRATDRAVVFTDSRERLAEQIDMETGQKETALSRPEPQPPTPTPPTPAPWDAEHVRGEHILVEQAPAVEVTAELDFER